MPTADARYPDVLAVTPATAPVDAEVTLPGSKSYTNRALILAALADGRSTIREALFSDDTRYMAAALARLGIDVRSREGDRCFAVDGRAGRIPAPTATLYVGNSGTSARFLTALVALGHGEYIIDGDARMRQRPIAPLLDALAQLGVDAASIEGTGCPPIRIRSSGLAGGEVRVAGNTSSQYISALMMVAPLARRGIRIVVEGDLVSKPYIDLTADAMRAFGVSPANDAYRSIAVPGGRRYHARDYTVEPDASAASYFFALAAVTAGRVRVRHLGRRSAQGDLRFVDVLERMGCDVSREDDAVTVRGPARLRGVDVDMNAISDTVQTLAAIAPLADGPVTIRNVAHIRHKETDRLAALASELRRLGVTVEERDDGLTIYPASIRPATVQTYDDHRMAMSFAILSTAVPGVAIADPRCVTKTFPDFFATLDRALGRVDA